MRRFIIAALFTALVATGCGGPKGAKLEKGTPIYDLAVELAKAYPAVDPDANKTLVKCKYFQITPGTFFTEMQLAMGKNIDQIKTLDPKRLPDFLKVNIERMGERNLLLEGAKKAGVAITPAQVDSTLQFIYTQNGGEEAFIQRIGSDGISIETVKADIEREMVIRKYFDKLYNEVKVTDEDLNAAYNQDKTASVRHILLMTQGKDEAGKADVRKKMEELLRRAKAGEDFATLATENTEDPGSKTSGGLYENFPKGHMVKPFEDAAFSVPVGEISDIIETQYGYHILKVVDRKKETRPLAEVKSELEQQLLRGKRRDLNSSIVEKLKKDSGYQIFV
ncbi:MAG TPA: peptidylprolyl isomerase [bacterium]|nr:peptidylprolyl isomerase [bacterium]HOC24140.1 peptidylprolyl isomerase [bacterium]HOY43511.1 peptidylprolyl isomerase [bacterium]HPG81706.1 peptidylprolyl isomerase [bacterium]HPM58017.1 peptidylprolyl isomerase [bacterium]